MPEILIIYRDDQSGFDIEQAAQTEGLRTKSTFDAKTALEWLGLRTFDGLFIDASISLAQQQALADALWRKNYVAPFVTFTIGAGTSREQSEARLFGAEVVSGEEALTKMQSYLKAIAACHRGALPGLQDFRILVVEDLDSPRDIISMYVENLGFPLVHGCSSATQALTELRSAAASYSCVITDIRMPKMSGKELIESIRQDPKLASLPIIVLTAYGTVDCLFDCLKAGASGFLVKPPKKKDLSLQLQRAVRIAAYHLDPRLVGPEEAEEMRLLLVDKGLF